MQQLVNLPNSATWGRQVEIRDPHEDGSMTVYIIREGGTPHTPVSSGFEQCYAQELPSGEVWAVVPTTRDGIPILTFDKALEIFQREGRLDFAAVIRE